MNLCSHNDWDLEIASTMSQISQAVLKSLTKDILILNPIRNKRILLKLWYSVPSYCIVKLAVAFEFQGFEGTQQ